MLLQQRELSQIGAQFGLALRDVFLARTGELQHQRLLIHGQPGIGGIERGLGRIHVLAAHRSAG